MNSQRNDLPETLRDSRKNPSVLKIRLISIRGTYPCGPVCVFEGRDDVGVYGNWISRISNDLPYRTIVGNGKEQLLRFAESLSAANDPSLSKAIYFFVDADFDAEQPDVDNVFVLDAYSVENCLVGLEVLSSLLFEEFGLHDDNVTREDLIMRFQESMKSFLMAAYEANFRLFGARRLNIRVLGKPETASDIAQISVENVNIKPGELGVRLEREFSDDERVELRVSFEALPARLQSRGKYVLSFMQRWILLLAEDGTSDKPKYFPRTTPKTSHRAGTVTMRDLASRSTIPAGLADFAIKLVQQEAAAI